MPFTVRALCPGAGVLHVSLSPPPALIFLFPLLSFSLFMHSPARASWRGLHRAAENDPRGGFLAGYLPHGDARLAVPVHRARRLAWHQPCAGRAPASKPPGHGGPRRLNRAIINVRCRACVCTTGAHCRVPQQSAPAECHSPAEMSAGDVGAKWVKVHWTACTCAATGAGRRLRIIPGRCWHWPSGRLQICARTPGTNWAGPVQ